HSPGSTRWTDAAVGRRRPYCRPPTATPTPNADCLPPTAYRRLPTAHCLPPMPATTPIDVYKDWLGIPEGPRPPDHYQLLRLVRFEDDAEKIRAHYKKLNAHVRKYATGTYSVESQDLLNELAKAMLCLTDEER